MMTKAQKAKRHRYSKGFDPEEGGSAGQAIGRNGDKKTDMDGHEADTLPQLMDRAVDILRTADRTEGRYSAVAIAEVCECDDSTIRNRWLKSLNSEISDEFTLRADNGRFTELAMRLFAEIASCSLTAGAWVLQVLQPALASMPNEQRTGDEVAEDPYTSTLARRKTENNAASKAAQIEFEELKRQRQVKQAAMAELSATEIERIRTEEKRKLVREEQAREAIRQELMEELGML